MVKYAGRNVLEALFVAMTVAVIAFAIPYLSIQYGASCIDKAKFEEPGKVGGVELPKYSVFYCPRGNGTKDDATVNDYALLFFQPSEDTIKMLFHSVEDLSVGSLAIFSLFYFFLACATYGIAVPSGLFVPSLLLGAAFGRLYGQLLGSLLSFTAWNLSQPGVYALIGSAAMLGGMARMTISITVIMIEATNDYSYGLPLMLTLMTARWVGNCFNEGLYDIHIHLNQVPLLEGTSLVGPWEQTRAQDILTAADIMSPCQPEEHQMEEVEKVGDVLGLLRRSKANAFFVVEPNSGPFAGLILRRQLCQLLKQGAYTKAGVLPEPVMWDDTVNTYPKCSLSTPCSAPPFFAQPSSLHSSLLQSWRCSVFLLCYRTCSDRSFPWRQSHRCRRPRGPWLDARTLAPEFRTQIWTWDLSCHRRHIRFRRGRHSRG